MKFNKTISFIFHPIIIPIVGTILYFIFLPRHIDVSIERSIILSTFITAYILPIIFIYLLKKLKLIDTYEMTTVEERKFPLMFFTVLSYVLGILLYRTDILTELALFYFGMTLVLLISYLLLYIDFKISMHTIGIGGLIGFIGLLSYSYELNLIILLAFLFVLAGVIATSRLILKAHQGKEVYLGFFIGLLTQIIAYFFYNI